jgi:hypothetical protein
VNWDDVFEEGSRLYGIVRNRHQLRETGASHADIVNRHPTGYRYLDDARLSSPSILGDAVRRVLYRKETGADPPWHEPTVLHRVRRRMSERPDGGEGAGGHLRRLGVAFFEATIAAPFSFVDTLMPSGVTVGKSEITFWEATLRYIVSSTVGCYFVAPNNDEIDTQGDEGPEGGDRMFVMRPGKEKLCFPAWPFALPQVPEFRVITRTQGVDQYGLNYHDYCHGRGSVTQEAADGLEALGIDPRSENLLAPNVAVLRTAEAVDAILNAATSGSPEVENSMNAGRILCSSTIDPPQTPFRPPPTRPCPFVYLNNRRPTARPRPGPCSRHRLRVPRVRSLPAGRPDLLHADVRHRVHPDQLLAAGQLHLPAAL